MTRGSEPAPGPPDERSRRRDRIFLLVCFVPAIAIAATLPVVSSATGIPVRQFTRDVFSIGEIPVWSGIVSNVGLVLWTAAAAVGAMGAAVGGGGSRARRALSVAAAISFVLLVDDALLFHEFIAPDHLGIPEFFVTTGYGALTASWIVIYRSEILSRRPLLLALAMGLFLVSLGMDRVEPAEAEWWRYWIEESAKLLGIVGWFGYIVLFAADLLRAAPRG